MDIQTKSAERELETRCKILFELTKEMAENETWANIRFYYWAYHETWMLKLFPKCLASKKAYELFYEKYKDDIRKYNWFDKKVSEWRSPDGKRQFMHEHVVTSNDFKNQLLYLYKENQLSVEKIKELISQQRVCWVTREEDNLLSKKYKDHRQNPLKVYEECGVELYDSKNENLDNIMISSFPSLPKKEKIIKNPCEIKNLND